MARMLLGGSSNQCARQPCCRAALKGPLASLPFQSSCRHHRHLSCLRPAPSGAAPMCRAAAPGTQQSGLNMEDLNSVSSKAVRIMLRGAEDQAVLLRAQLEQQRSALLQAGDADAAHFLGLLQGMLAHNLNTKSTEQLSGSYIAAFNRMSNSLQGSDWKLVASDKSDAQAFAEAQPKWSTWDDVKASKQKRQQASSSASSSSTSSSGDGDSYQSSSSSSSSSSSPAGPLFGRPGAPLELGHYNTLNISASASQAEIKAAYRKLALVTHPDVSDAADANEKFLLLTTAYDVLSDESSRRLYDTYGAAGMASRPGAAAGFGNARQAWDEFKPFKRENKHTKARDASRAASGDAASTSGSSDLGSAGTSGTTAAAVPVAGDIVEYPIPLQEQQQLCDGRSHGVALLVGRNMDRGDAAKLPPELLDVCEVEPLRQEEPDSNRWVVDELASSAYPRLDELLKVPFAAYDSRYDVWSIDVALSPGCAGPELPDEVML